MSLLCFLCGKGWSNGSRADIGTSGSGRVGQTCCLALSASGTLPQGSSSTTTAHPYFKCSSGLAVLLQINGDQLQWAILAILINVQDCWYYWLYTKGFCRQDVFSRWSDILLHLLITPPRPPLWRGVVVVEFRCPSGWKHHNHLFSAKGKIPPHQCSDTF